MRNIMKKLSLCLAFLIITMTNMQTVFADQNPPSGHVFTPCVLVDEITNNSTIIPVYVYEDTTLYVKNGSKTIFHKFYKEKGRKNIKIKKQKGNSRLKLYLVSKDSGKRGRIVTKKVTKLPVVAKEKILKSMARPKIQKIITSEDKVVEVSGKKGATLVIRNEKKMLKSIKFKKNESKHIMIPKQKSGILYFYLKKGSSRGKIVSRIIRDVTAPAAPKLKINSTSIYVKGELGSEIYFKGANGWRHLGTSISKKWNSFFFGIDYNDIECEYFEVYLKDACGNESERVSVKNPFQELPDPPNI